MPIIPRANWHLLYEKSTTQDVFIHPNYAALYENDGVEATAFLFENHEGSVIYPFLIRSLSHLAFFPQGTPPAFHIETPYGYGGPVVVEGLPSEALYREFHRAFEAWAVEQNVVSEFVRFNLFSDARQHYGGEVVHNNDNIVVSLGQNLDGLWKAFHHKVRKNVQKAVAQGVEVIIDEQGEMLEQFLENYYHTLDRRRAVKRYYFPKEFFGKIHHSLSGKYCYFHSVYQGRVVSSELVLLSGTRLYSFLGGTLEEFFHLRPGDLLKYRIIQWAKEQGYRQFVIGGGHEPHDGIFAFKKAFAPQGIVPFFVGKKIFNKELYNKLVAASGNGQSEFFPAYLEG